MKKCSGLLGWLFGHKYLKAGFDGVSSFCLRCGVKHE